MLSTKISHSSYEALPDAELLTESQTHPQAFEVIVRRYQERFLRRAQSVVGRVPEAEDIVAEAFVKIYFNGRSFTAETEGSFRAWAYKILMNTALSYYRRLAQHGRALPQDPLILAECPDPVNEYERASIGDFVRKTLSLLPDTFSRVLKLYFLEGRSQNEIARMEDLSLSAVKTRIHRAKREFKRLSIQYGYTE